MEDLSSIASFYVRWFLRLLKSQRWTLSQSFASFFGAANVTSQTAEQLCSVQTWSTPGMMLLGPRRW